ncbi:MAG: ATP synthase F1 subunit delta [Elusimicrobia bacterium]|nr:ATP synthase F1 subunit delta [Elusimicrobiota bacterium]
MRSSDQILASRYARALFEAASASKTADAVAGELDLAGEVAAHPDAAAVFKTPRLGTAEKKKLFRDLLGARASAVTLRFVDLLLERKRLDLLGAAALSYGKFLAEGRGTAKAVVGAARKPSEADLEAIRRRLEAFVGLKVELEVRSDPALLAGVLVRLGDWVLDSSLAGQLERLKRRIS